MFKNGKSELNLLNKKFIGIKTFILNSSYQFYFFLPR